MSAIEKLWQAVGSHLLYLAVFGSVFAFGMYLTLIGRIGADRAAYTTLLFPIVALALSMAFEKYRGSVGALVGVGLILMGNYIVLKRRSQEPVPRSQ